jgi:hypothetical protein
LRFGNILAVNTQVFLFQGKNPFTQVSLLKINQPLGIKGVSLVSRFEMQMGTG